MSGWVAFTLLAALMQAVRTAGQKKLSSDISPMGSTFVRYAFGLPFVAVYLLYIAGEHSQAHIALAVQNPRFLLFATLASIGQIIATFLLVKVFSFRNFAVGTSLAKTEAVQAAVLATVFFASPLSAMGWLAVLIGFVGIFILSKPGYNQTWNIQSVSWGLLSGTAFALTSLWLREASLSLNTGVLTSAAVTLFIMVCFQTVLCVVYLYALERDQFSGIRKQLRLASFVGLTSALGSVGWFTAMTWENPALVKSLGQIEIVFTLLLTTMLFGERVTVREYAGVLIIIASVLLLLLLK
ncbi:MAG: DMT family transporter [Granulosicoccus sp.]